jgi:ferredoxin
VPAEGSIITHKITCGTKISKDSFRQENKKGGFYIMAYVINDDCVSCGACAEVCPAEAISEGDGKYVIDADACLDCGTCEAECPNNAISAE